MPTNYKNINFLDRSVFAQCLLIYSEVTKVLQTRKITLMCDIRLSIYFTLFIIATGNQCMNEFVFFLMS